MNAFSTTRHLLTQEGQLVAIEKRLAGLDRFWEKEQTKSDVEIFILDHVFTGLPTPPFSTEDKERVAANVSHHIWQQTMQAQSTSMRISA